MMRLRLASASRTHRSGSPVRSTSSSIGFTYAGAPPCRLRLEIGRRVSGQPCWLVGLGIGHLRLEVVVDEQPPDVLVGVAPDELFDVDAAVAERAAFAVGLGDLGLDGDDAFQAGLE